MLNNHFKLTNQRSIILDFLKANYTHPSVDEVFAYVRARLPRISKKTVYENLQFLSREGLIQEAMVRGVRRYEPKIGPHPHVICRRCGRIMDMESKELLSHAVRLGKKIKDFDVESVSVTFYGICKRCREGDKDGRKKQGRTRK